MKLAEILFKTQIRQIIKDSYNSGFTKGYEMGHKVGMSDGKGHGCILAGLDIQKQVDEIARAYGI